MKISFVKMIFFITFAILITPFLAPMTLLVLDKAEITKVFILVEITET